MRAPLQGMIVALCRLAAISEAGLRKVLVMRHCVRSTSAKMKHVIDNYTLKADYTSHPIAMYGVADMSCTPQGVEIVRGIGRHLHQLGGKYAHAQIISAPQQRAMDTAAALLQGLGQDDSTYSVDCGTFNTLQGDDPLCSLEVSQAELQAQVRSQLFKVPTPWDLDSAKLEMQELIGVGAAGPLVEIPGPEVLPGTLAGSVNVLKYFAQDLFYTYASNLQYLNASVQQRYRWLAWVHWHRRVSYWQEKTATRNAKLLHVLLERLFGDDVGTDISIYVGHDTNLDALSMFLDLSWEAPPYMNGSLPTPPGSTLLFEYDEDADIVNVSFHYNTYEVAAGSEVGYLHRSSVLSGLSREQFRARAMSGLHRYPHAIACFEANAASGERGQTALITYM